jgi:CcmD family protein
MTEASSNVPWLLAALAVVGIAIGGYVALLAARRRKVEDKLRELEGRHPEP